MDDEDCIWDMFSMDFPIPIPLVIFFAILVAVIWLDCKINRLQAEVAHLRGEIHARDPEGDFS